jgi:HPt (histidine-containing phosphotransfer) domain-containing protein
MNHNRQAKNSAKAHVAAPPPANESLVDMEKFLSSFDGTAADLEELTALYLRETERSVDEIASALATGDSGALRVRAHAGYGGSAQVGLRGVAQVFRQLQQAGAEGALERGEALLPQARAELEKARQFLTSYLAWLRLQEAG